MFEDFVVSHPKRRVFTRLFLFYIYQKNTPINRSSVSYYTLILVGLIYFLISFFYYPKFSNKGTEASISWDVAGYYQYLPSIFIYKDLKTQEETNKMQKKYYYSPYSDQYYKAENGNKVMKYSIGMSILYLPAFTTAHAITTFTSYPSDGYSLPYQFLLTLQGILVFLLGLFYLRKVLLNYFTDTVVSWVLIVIALVTNALEYGAITNAMSHNYLFLGYTLILYQSIKISESNKWKNYIVIALTIGLMALSRPTEAITVLIPVMYILFQAKTSLKEFVGSNWNKILASAVIIATIGSIQLIYWYYVSGQFIQYSYQDQGFSWLKPHIIDGLFSFKAGWLIYSPVMILSLIGFHSLYKIDKTWFKTLFIYTLLFIYIAFAWDIWWYGGSLGQRTMVQIYPILAFPLAAFFTYFKGVGKTLIVTTFIMVCGFLNAWLIHHAHKGGLMKVGEMTKPYYLAIAGRNQVKPEVSKLLDARYIHTKELIDPEIIFEQNEDQCLDKEIQSTPSFYLDVSNHKLLRLAVDYVIEDIEYEQWRWTQLIVKYLDSNDKHIRTDMLRIQRVVNKLGLNSEYLDSKVSRKAEKAEVYLWHAESDKRLCIKNIKVIAHR